MCNCSSCKPDCPWKDKHLGGSAAAWPTSACFTVDAGYGAGGMSGASASGMPIPNGTALPFGTCLLHGFHGKLSCPGCSTSVHMHFPIAVTAPVPQVSYLVVPDGYLLVTVEQQARLVELELLVQTLERRNETQAELIDDLVDDFADLLRAAGR